jgi:sulfonate transport system substrate-binding protein
MINRRSFIAATGASLALAACGRAGGSDKVLRVGSQKGGTKSLMLAAGVLNGADFAVEWAEFPAAQNLLEALGSNAIDVGLAGDAPFQFAYQSGSPIQAVSAQRSSGEAAGVLAIVVPKGSSVRRLEDLRGKQVATGRGSIGHYLILRVLRRAGWSADAIKIVLLSPSDAAAALAAGSVAAWSTWGPYVPLAIEQGGRIVVEGNAYTEGYSFEAANVAAIESKREILVDFLNREAKALGWASRNASGDRAMGRGEGPAPGDADRWRADPGPARSARHVRPRRRDPSQASPLASLRAGTGHRAGLIAGLFAILKSGQAKLDGSALQVRYRAIYKSQPGK